MSMKKILAALLLIFSPATTFAVREIEAHVKHDNPMHFEFSAYGLGSYNYLVRSARFTSGSYNRGSTIATNGLRLNQAYLQITELPEEGFGGFMNMVVGQEAILIAPDGWNPEVFNLRNFGVTVPEAYLEYVKGPFTLKVGEMLALAGIESFVFTEDTNFSRSLVDAYAQPGIHIGVRGIARLTDRVSFIVGTGNGWSTIRHPGKQTRIEFGVDYEVKDKFMLNINGYSGDQHLTDGARSGQTGRRNLIDIFGTYQVTDKLQLAWNLDYGTQTKAALPFDVVSGAKWRGIDAYLNYQYTDDWRSSVRGEVLDDSDGYRTGVRQVLKEVTLTVGYKPVKSIEIIAEARHDFSNQASYVNKGGEGANHNQQSFSLAALYRTD